MGSEVTDQGPDTICYVENVADDTSKQFSMKVLCVAISLHGVRDHRSKARYHLLNGCFLPNVASGKDMAEGTSKLTLKRT